MKWWKALIAAGLVLGALLIIVGGLKERSAPPTEVQVAKVRKGTITRVLSGAGKVQPATTVKISSNLSGDLVELLVKEGDRVTRGQVLGRIDKRRFDAALKQSIAAQSASYSDVQVAQVDVARAEKEVERVEGLVSKGLASAAELQNLQADLESAKARLAGARQRSTQAMANVEEARTSVENTTLISPIDGTVIELSREVGERVIGSDFQEDVVMVIASLAAMEVEIEVGEHEIVHMEVGQRADVTLDALEHSIYEGTVVQIAQKALIKNEGTESEVTTFPVKVALTTRPAKVLPGMSAELRIYAETHDGALLVPIQSVTVRPSALLPGPKEQPDVGDGTSVKSARREALAKVVFVVDAQNTVQPRRVVTGIASDTELEILEGLEEGERVVEGPYRTLSKDLSTGQAIIEAGGGMPRKG